jgi:hypothetical protein
MDLKRRKSPFHSFHLINCTLHDTDLYYMTAFIRRHYFFENFTLSGKVFHVDKRKGLPTSHLQSLQFILDEILGKRIKNLTINIDLTDLEKLNLIEKVLT